MISGQLKFRSPEKACYDLRLWDKIEYHKYLDGEYMLVLNFDHPFALQTADVRGGPFRPQPVPPLFRARLQTFLQQHLLQLGCSSAKGMGYDKSPNINCIYSILHVYMYIYTLCFWTSNPWKLVETRWCLPTKNEDISKRIRDNICGRFTCRNHEKSPTISMVSMDCWHLLTRDSIAKVNIWPRTAKSWILLKSLVKPLQVIPCFETIFHLELVNLSYATHLRHKKNTQTEGFKWNSGETIIELPSFVVTPSKMINKLWPSFGVPHDSGIGNPFNRLGHRSGPIFRICAGQSSYFFGGSRILVPDPFRRLNHLVLSLPTNFKYPAKKKSGTGSISDAKIPSFGHLSGEGMTSFIEPPLQHGSLIHALWW